MPDVKARESRYSGCQSDPAARPLVAPYNRAGAPRDRRLPRVRPVDRYGPHMLLLQSDEILL